MCHSPQCMNQTEPNHVEKSEDWDPIPDNPVEVAPEGPHSEPSRTVLSNIFTDS